MRFCDLDEIKICVDRQYENCHGYSGSKKAIYREAILAVKSILHSAKSINAVPVVRCSECIAYTPVDDNTGKCVFLIGEHQYTSPHGYCHLGERKGGAE